MTAYPCKLQEFNDSCRAFGLNKYTATFIKKTDFCILAKCNPTDTSTLIAKFEELIKNIISKYNEFFDYDIPFIVRPFQKYMICYLPYKDSLTEHIPLFTQAYNIYCTQSKKNIVFTPHFYEFCNEEIHALYDNVEDNLLDVGYVVLRQDNHRHFQILGFKNNKVESLDGHSDNICRMHAQSYYNWLSNQDDTSFYQNL